MRTRLTAVLLAVLVSLTVGCRLDDGGAATTDYNPPVGVPSLNGGTVDVRPSPGSTLTVVAYKPVDPATDDTAIYAVKLTAFAGTEGPQDYVIWSGDGLGGWYTLTSSAAGTEVEMRFQVADDGTVVLLAGDPFPGASIPMRSSGSWDPSRDTVGALEHHERTIRYQGNKRVEEFEPAFFGLAWEFAIREG